MILTDMRFTIITSADGKLMKISKLRREYSSGSVNVTSLLSDIKAQILVSWVDLTIGTSFVLLPTCA